jgi:hypothetical protein
MGVGSGERVDENFLKDRFDRSWRHDLLLAGLTFQIGGFDDDPA